MTRIISKPKSGPQQSQGRGINVSKVKLTTGTEAAGAIDHTIQFLDVKGNPIKHKIPFRVYALNSSGAVLVVNATPAATKLDSIVVKASNGIQTSTPATDDAAAIHGVSKADGTTVITTTHAHATDLDDNVLVVEAYGEIYENTETFDHQTNS